MLGKPTNSEQSTNTGYKLTCSLCQLVDNIRDVHKIYMIINTEGDFIAPWHLAPKELVKEQGAREQWIYLTSTQFSYLKMLGKPTNSKQSTNTGYKLTCSLCQPKKYMSDQAVLLPK